jgi:hypothetical protein
MFIAGLGVTFLGLIIGIFTYRILQSRADAPAISDLTAVVGIVGGAVVFALLRNEVLLGWYSIGLALGFFACFAVERFEQQGGLPWRMPPFPPTSRPGS